LRQGDQKWRRENEYQWLTDYKSLEQIVLVSLAALGCGGRLGRRAILTTEQ